MFVYPLSAECMSLTDIQYDGQITSSSAYTASLGKNALDLNRQSLQEVAVNYL